MPLTPDMRRSIEQIRDYLYGGGYPDPVSNAEQLAFLFFFYLIEGIDAENEARSKVLKQKHESLFKGNWTLKNPLNAITSGEKTIPRTRFRWSVWAKGLSGEPLVRFVRDEVFPFFTEVAGNGAVNFMHGARLAIDEPTVLTQVVTLVDGLRLDRADADSKGDLFEHVLKQIKQAGELGQFRTPRHIIRTIVEIIDPQIGETIYDPAAGTAGFLVAAYTVRPNLNAVALVPPELDDQVASTGFSVLRATSAVLPQYLFYFVRSRRFIDSLGQLVAGAMYPAVTDSQVLAQLLPLPDIGQQRRIVDTLSRAEGIVRLRRAAQEKAAEIIPALFLDMFGDPATNPKDWPVDSFGHLVLNRDGQRRPVKAADRVKRKGQYPYYGASGVIDFIDEYLFDGRHLLIAEDGANLLSRSTPIAFQATGRYWVNNHAHVVAEKNGADLTYLEAFLNLRDLRDSITGSAQPKLTQASMNAIPVAIPPVREQKHFAFLVAQLASLSEQQESAIASAEACFKSLLDQMFTAVTHV